jgi:hypothetical protein
MQVEKKTEVMDVDEGQSSFSGVPPFGGEEV